jgi:hypothetical protein
MSLADGPGQLDGGFPIGGQDGQVGEVVMGEGVVEMDVHVPFLPCWRMGRVNRGMAAGVKFRAVWAVDLITRERFDNKIKL